MTRRFFLALLTALARALLLYFGAELFRLVFHGVWPAGCTAAVALVFTVLEVQVI
jgi:hypothetical protein